MNCWVLWRLLHYRTIFFVNFEALLEIYQKSVHIKYVDLVPHAWQNQRALHFKWANSDVYFKWNGFLLKGGKHKHMCENTIQLKIDESMNCPISGWRFFFFFLVFDEFFVAVNYNHVNSIINKLLTIWTVHRMKRICVYARYR